MQGMHKNIARMRLSLQAELLERESTVEVIFSLYSNREKIEDYL